MTLLLGPPSSGKTSLLLALTAKLDKALKVRLLILHTYMCSLTIQFHSLSFQLKFVNQYLSIALFFKDLAWLSIKVHDHHYHHPNDVQFLNNSSLLIKEVHK
jgi:hypothetical protein